MGFVKLQFHRIHGETSVWNLSAGHRVSTHLSETRSLFVLARVGSWDWEQAEVAEIALGSGDLGALLLLDASVLAKEKPALLPSVPGTSGTVPPHSTYAHEVLVELLEQNLKWKDPLPMVSNGSISRSCKLPVNFPRSISSMNLSAGVVGSSDFRAARFCPFSCQQG